MRTATAGCGHIIGKPSVRAVRLTGVASGRVTAHDPVFGMGRDRERILPAIER